jgi:hypothetical protein
MLLLMSKDTLSNFCKYLASATKKGKKLAKHKYFAKSDRQAQLGV